MSTYDRMYRINKFPCSNGHPAWTLNAQTVEDAATEDLLYRKIQTDPHFTESVVREFWPDARRTGDELLLASDISVSLARESCGAYCRNRGRARLYTLLGDNDDMRHIKHAAHRPLSQGYCLGPLFQHEQGWQPNTVVGNILRRMQMRLKPTDRYLFSQKACHRHVLMSPKDREEAVKAFQNFYLVTYGFNRWKVYWYNVENGATTFGVVYFYNDAHEVIKLPVTAWKSASASGYVNSLVYDALHPVAPYPIYRLYHAIRMPRTPNYALICTDEKTVDYIVKHHGWLASQVPIITYSAIVGTDWEVLKPRILIIFPSYNTSGCYEALKLHAEFQKLGFTCYFFKPTRSDKIWHMARDLFKFTEEDSECALPEFVMYCEREFGVKPPPGILPQAVPLLSLPESNSKPEPLLEGLLDHGELMMLYAWRGVGKSLFALFLAICFAFAKTAFGGRICPSRKYHTLLIDAEMSPGSLKRRALALCDSLGLPESAANELSVRSARNERKELKLDTEAGWKDLEPDMMQAEVIVVDSLFKLFPSAMTSEFSGTAALQDFFEWCIKHNKTLIIIDHEGKKGSTSFGSMGKEIGLDVVIQLINTKGVAHVKVTKIRNHAPVSGSWLQYRISCTSDGSISLEESVTSAREHENTQVLSSSEHEVDARLAKGQLDGALDEKIISYIQEHPEQTQGAIVDKLNQMALGGRSKLQARIKVLRETDQLPFWENAPRRGQTESTDSLEGVEKQ